MILTSQQLRARVPARAISGLLERGELIRAGRLYATPDTDGPVLAALAAGMRPTCLTAARVHGLWVPPGSGVHVHARRRRAGVGWVDHGWHQSWPEDEPVASPRLLLAHAAGCLDALDVGILADSAVRQGRLDHSDIDQLSAGAPRAVARVLARVSGLAESGTESKVRLFLERHRVPVRPQVVIGEVGRVDLLVGGRWIIECDSRAHHTGVETYAADRHRDLRAVELGYFTTRLTHRMVFAGWERTSRSLMSIVRSGRHLDPPSRWAL